MSNDRHRTWQITDKQRTIASSGDSPNGSAYKKMPPNPRSRVTLRPSSITFDESASLPAERTYARDYTTDQVLGEGGMGKVFAARDVNLGRRVAIKELRPEVRGRADLWGRFVREAQIGGQLEHPNIVPIYAFQFSPEGGPAFVMQLIDGESLADYIDRARQTVLAGKQGAPSLKERVAMILPICNAMAYAHGRGVLHRDLKPENVMLGPHNVVLVTDWGIARVDGDLAEDDDDEAAATTRDTIVAPPRQSDNAGASPEEISFAPTFVTSGGQSIGADSSPDVVKTAVGAIMGTPQYMSPEQAIGVPVGQASDQYALGLMCLELATLRMPRSCENTSSAYAQAILGEQCAHIDSSDVPLDPRLSAIISRANQKAPEARYESVEKFADDLRAFLLDQEVSVLPDSRARKFIRALQKHPVRSVSVGAVVLLLLAVWALIGTTSAATRATAARQDAEALSRLSAAVLSDGREIERYLLEMDSDLVGLAQTVRVRLEDESKASRVRPVILQPSDLGEGKDNGVVRNPVDGTLRSYREPVFVYAPGASPDAKAQALRIAASKNDLIDIYVAGIDESALALSEVQQEALMAKDQSGIVRLIVALDSGLFVQFPGRTDIKEDYDARTTDWYKLAMAARGSHFSRPKYGPLATIPRMAVTRPIESKGKFIGVVAAGFWLRPLVERLGVRAAPRLKSAFLAAPDGKEIANRALLEVATQGEPEGPVTLFDVKSPALRRALAAKKETGYVVEEDELFVYTRLAVEDWVLVHQYEREHHLRLIHQ